jgi:DNA-binding NarL/FixJ family response regulator
VRIVICDDHRLLAEALASAVVRAGHTVVAVVGTPADALVALDRCHPDVLLLDLTFPDGDSLEAARAAVVGHPRTRTVLLTGSDAVQPMQEALDIGVAGYLRKNERIDQMLDVLRRCVLGEQVFDEVLLRRLERSRRQRELSRCLVTELTRRESAVADLLREGLSTAQIVASLGIGESTVRTHVQAILNKLSVHSRLEAVALLEGTRVLAGDAIS